MSSSQFLWQSLPIYRKACLMAWPYLVWSSPQTRPRSATLPATAMPICSSSLSPTLTLMYILKDPFRHISLSLYFQYVADTLEELVIMCITINASPITMATCTNFGDPDHHSLCKGSSILANIQKVITSVSPSKIVAFFKAGKQYHLNSVQWPFWANWVTTDPSFLMPESLHCFQKMFFDYDCA